MRRISTLKKADLIDAMLKRDEEEAIILRQERIQRRQQQEASQNAENEGKNVRRPAADTAAAAAGPSREEETAAGNSPEAAGRYGDERASEQDKSGSRQGQNERTAQDSSPAGQNRPDGAGQERTVSAGEGGQSRQRGQGSARGRQGTGTYNTGNTTGRSQTGRTRRDDRQNQQNSRQPRQARQNTAGQDKNRPSDSARGRIRFADQGQERNGRGADYPDKGRFSETAADRSRSGGAAGVRDGGREQYRDARPESAQEAPLNGTADAVYRAGVSETADGAVRDHSAVFQNMQTAWPADDAGQEVRQESRPDDGQIQGNNGTPQDGQQDAQAARLSRFYQPGRPDTPVLHKDELNTELDSGQMANGILEVMQDGFGFIRCANYMPGENDIYVAPSQIRRFGLKTGDIIVGNIRVRTQGEKFSALLYVKSVNGLSPEEANRRYNFEDMTPVFPDERIRLERSGGTVAMRIMDLMSPVGKGQRGMIVSPPKAGKTTLIKEVARSVKYNNPEIHLIVLLIDERPEEVTDIREAIEGPNAEVIYSTFDELPEHHKRVSEMVIERARRLVEHKKDVMILLDSITRLTRAYNITEPSSGRTLSGGLDPAALHMPKRFFGAARNMREGGSLTILATALIDTGSKMDDIVFEEFKGTGNMELVLDRRLSERRIFPAIDIVRSGTRRDDLLLTPDEQSAMSIVRRAFNGLSAEQAVTQALDLFSRTRTNGEFVNMVRKIQWGSAPERPHTSL